MGNYEKLDRCLICNGKKLVPYLDLGRQPPANAYHKEQQKLKRYPLGIQLCETCFHSQLTHKVDNHIMFDDYLYVMDTSETLRSYFQGFADMVLKNWKGRKPPRVLEIACNNGYLLTLLKDRGCVVNGVEPAMNLIEICESRGLNEKNDSEVYGGYWSIKMAQDLLTWEHTKYDIIIAINVLPHVPNPVDFMEACKLMLDPTTKGSGIYIQTSQCDMFKNGEFDAIYHEHHSYFTVSSFGTLAYASGLEIKSARKVPIHSMSFLFNLGPMSGCGHSNDLYDMLEVENAEGWHTVERYKEWASEVDDKR
ncbi:MAG TPA: methyltransferase domain-containing protein, partial [Methylomirabilota bacterium]|nr:methyltransferase domain-containing protein [Methylomirabilota bacterium]